VGPAGRQVQPEAAGALLDQCADFEQFAAQGVGLGAAQARVAETCAEQDDELVGQCVQREPERVGFETVAGQPVGFELVLEFLDIVLCLPASFVEVEQAPRIARTVGDHEAQVRAFGSGFSLHEHPQVTAPGFRAMGELGVQPGFLAGGPKLAHSLLQEGLRLILENFVRPDGDGETDLVALAEVVQSGHCEAGVGPQFDDRVREGGLQTRDDGLQCGQDILGGVGIAGPQESAEDATRAAFVDQQRMVHVLVEKPVEGDELLLPVGRVVGAVQFENDHRRLVLAADEAVGEQVVEGPDLAGRHRILQPRQAGLAAQFLAEFGLAGDELEEPVVAQPVGVVLVFVPGDDSVQALDDELLDVVADVRGVAPVAQAAGDAVGETDALIELAQGDETGIGRDLATVKIQADLAIIAEGEGGLHGALCIHGRDLPERLYGALPGYSKVPAASPPRYACIERAKLSASSSRRSLA